MVDLLGRLLGEKHLAKRLAARRIDIPGARVTPIAWAEVAGTLIALIERAHLVPLDLAYGMQFRTAAWASRKYLNHADVLLVRSGAGQSGAIGVARKNGLAIVTDHSIAHPAFIHSVLRQEFERFGLSVGYDPKSDLWKLVLRDCAGADLLLVNSDFVKQTFVDLGYPAGKIRVAYLGVREIFFDLKRDYRIDGPVKILFTGNFDIRKGDSPSAGGHPQLPAGWDRSSAGVDWQSGKRSRLPDSLRRRVFPADAFRSSRKTLSGVRPCRPVCFSNVCRGLFAVGNGSRRGGTAYHHDQELRPASGAWEERDLRAGQRCGIARGRDQATFLRPNLALLLRQDRNEDGDRELYLEPLWAAGRKSLGGGRPKCQSLKRCAGFSIKK